MSHALGESTFSGPRHWDWTARGTTSCRQGSHGSRYGWPPEQPRATVELYSLPRGSAYTGQPLPSQLDLLRSLLLKLLGAPGTLIDARACDPRRRDITTAESVGCVRRYIFRYFPEPGMCGLRERLSFPTSRAPHQRISSIAGVHAREGCEERPLNQWAAREERREILPPSREAKSQCLYV